ncbi:MAG: SGNH/GDSL hydrolase family protein [Clostridia bacterium]|nr:SGNH/GDSL hydrolase family protein [Clostridia bacterium]
MENICLFGDSLARGVILDSKRMRYGISQCCFAGLLEESCDVKIENYAKFGCTIEKGFDIIEKHSKNIEKCDLVMLEFGGNDCDYEWEEVSKNPLGNFCAKTEINRFREIYEKIVGKLISMGKDVVMLSLPPIDSERYFSWISRNKNAENIKKWLGSISYIYRWHEMYSNAVCSIARKMKVGLIDLRSAFLEKRNIGDYICLDGIHPNENGQRLMCREIIKYGI